MKRTAALLVRRRTIVAASLSLIIFSATISVLLGIGAAPNSLIGNPDAYVITSKGSESLLNSLLETKLSDQLLANGFVDDVSPEIFAFADIEGRAVVIRGVEFAPFMAVEGATLIAGGSMPDEPSEGLIGSRLAERLNAKIGDRYPLVGSYALSIAEVTITGMIESSTSVEDEMMVSLPLARCLSGTPDGSVSIMRVTGNASELDKIFGSNAARFSMYDLSFANGIVSMGSSTTIGISLKNWGDISGTAHVTIRDETYNITMIDNYSALSAGATQKISFEHIFDAAGNHTIIAHLDGLLPQTITANIAVRVPYLNVIAQRNVVALHNFSVQVLDGTLSPVTAANVSLDGHHYSTNASGKCIVNATLPGNYTIVANLTGFEDGLAPVTVVSYSDLQPTALLQVYNLVLTPSTVKVRENCTVSVYVQNFGNSTGLSAIQPYSQGTLFKSQSVVLQPLESKVLYYYISFSSAGDREISSGSFTRTLVVESTYQVNPEIVQLLLRYGGTSSLDPSRGELLYHTAKISESNIIIVLVSLAVLSGLLVTLGVSISFMKEIHDNQKVIGILRSLGASSKQLMWIIFKETTLVSLPAAVIGVAGGCLLALLIQSINNLVAFGHLITPVLDPTFFIAAVAGSITICIASGLMAGLSVSRRRAIRMIKGLQEASAKQVTLKELLGED